MRVAARDETDYRVAERIVHHAVKLTAEQKAAAAAVAYLVRRVLPNLAEQQRVGLFGLYRGADSIEEAVGQLVRNVEPPARRSKPQPAAQYAVFAADELGERRVVLDDLGQTRHAPPAVAAVRPFGEPVPGVVRRLL